MEIFTTSAEIKMPRRVLMRSLIDRSITSIGQTTPTNDNILKINDHCLRKVFGYLELSDLAAVADVCSRFKQNAQAHFATSKHTDLLLSIGDAKPSEKFLQISREMRNFGAFAKSISVFGLCGIIDLKLHPTVIAAINMIRKYCTEKLTKLALYCVRISARIIRMLRPLFHNLKELSIQRGQAMGILLETFPKLESFTISCMKLNGNDLKGFVQRNLQLKIIGIIDCDEFNYDIFRSIATYVPQIEGLSFRAASQKGGTFEENRKYLCKLSKLKHLGVGGIGTSIASVVDDVAKANISIEHLQLLSEDDDDTPNQARQYIEAISKFKKLKRWIMHGNKCLSAQNVVQICKNLSKLQMIIFMGDPLLTADNIVELIRNGENLQRIICFLLGDENGRSFVDVSTYVKIVQILKGRHERKHLKLHLSAKNNCFNNIPEEMLIKHKDIITLTIIKNHY